MSFWSVINPRTTQSNEIILEAVQRTAAVKRSGRDSDDRLRQLEQDHRALTRRATPILDMLTVNREET